MANPHPAVSVAQSPSCCFARRTWAGEGRLQRVLDLSQEPYFGILCRSARRWQNHFRQNPTAMPAYAVSPAMLATLTSELVAVYVSSNKLPAIDVPVLVENVYRALQKIAEDSEGKLNFSPRKPDSTISVERHTRRRSLSHNPIKAMTDIPWPTKNVRRNRQRRSPGRRRRC